MTPLLLLALAVESAAASSPRPPEPTQSAFDFVNSIGVNTHLNYFDTPYGNFPLIARELNRIGIRHLRDGVHLQSADYNSALYGRWMALGKLGIRFDAVLDPRSNLGAITPALLEEVDQLSGHTIESFEGPNELDISNIPDWPAVDRGFQQAIFKAAQSLPDRKAIELIGPSLALAHHAPELGDISAYIDMGNLHPYPAAKSPSVIFPEQMDFARIMSGTKNIVVTESGYHNGLKDHSDQPGVSETAAAKYITRLYLENFDHGIARTYLYEFLDEFADADLKSFQKHWGLIRFDGTEKPAFFALENLIKELNDGAEPAHRVSLAWSLNSDDPRIHHLLLEKSSGELDLVLWQEIPSYDEKGQIDIVNPSRPAVLTFAEKARSVTVFEPVTKSDPIQMDTNVSRMKVEIPDHPLVIKITPE